jgi:uncharacterized LabA/DUF88 family protein
MAQDRLAVLIDADNAQADLVEPLLAEIAKFGVASVKRIYGDWTLPNLNSWKQRLVEHAIQPMQQFRYTTGKNATDSALNIDAMDLLYTGRFEGFCLVSSDSDFTRLATRLRESGLKVYGFGERKTPRSLIAACDKFTYVEIRQPTLQSKPSRARKPGGSAKSAPAKPAPEPRSAVAAPASAAPPELAALLASAHEVSADEAGWANLGSVGQYISKRQPDFDPRNYGHKRLSDLVKATDGFQVEQRPGADGKSTVFYVRRQ